MLDTPDRFLVRGFLAIAESCVVGSMRHMLIICILFLLPECKGGAALHAADARHSLAADTSIQSGRNPTTSHSPGGGHIGTGAVGGAQENVDASGDGGGGDETAIAAPAVRRGSAWEPYLRGPHPPLPQEPLLARLEPWLNPMRWVYALKCAFSSEAVPAAATRQALRMWWGGDSGSRGRGTGPGFMGPGSEGAGDAMRGFNQSDMAQLVPVDVAWRMAEEERHSKHGKIHYNQTHPDFDINIASSLAHLNSIAYCNHTNILNWNCTRCTGTATGFEVYAMIDDVEWDLFAYAGHSAVLGAKVVAFRGTDSHSWYNWAENMRFWRSDFGLPFPGAEGALVHSGARLCLEMCSHPSHGAERPRDISHPHISVPCGFFTSYNSSSLRPNITAAAQQLEEAYPDEPWYVIGHSMGSAMASICALDLKFTLGLKDVRVYTFGSPRVGNSVFATFFEENVEESFRITHNRDIVPSVPLQIMGFHHVPREVWVVTFDGGPTIIGLCNNSGEDPTCHNSVCYLGLCTSIADHMVYLGAHMYHRNPMSC